MDLNWFEELEARIPHDGVRTRFAPSPTGYMHVGNLRTALYTWLIARHAGGKFILRIEDTDQGRLVEGATDVIYNTLRKCGLTWDEGPDLGGPVGPYIQTQRRDLYGKFAELLVEKGHAYYCFCEKTESEEDSGDFDRAADPCRFLSLEEARARVAAGEPYVIRQRIPDEGTTTFSDAVFGDITVENKTLDDQVLMKRDGLPTYNFANVIDDHLMGITHVMRGTEYLSSAPKYNLLYEAFGWQPPVYIHLSPVMKDATRKLSKRYGDPSFEDLLAQGYVRDAIINFIALLGWSPGDEREFFTLDELVQAFDLKGLSKAPAIFNTEKLVWFNHEYITRMPFEEYLAMATPWFDRVLAGKGIDYRRLAELMHTRTEVFDRVPDMVRFLAELPEYGVELYTHKKMKTDSVVALRALELARPAMASLESFTEEAVKDCLMALAAENGLKTGQMMWPVRTALSGQASTPGGATEIAYLLGRDESLRRIDKGIEMLKNA